MLFCWWRAVRPRCCGCQRRRDYGSAARRLLRAAKEKAPPALVLRGRRGVKGAVYAGCWMCVLMKSLI
ncbi:MAG: hypothetical protein IJR28_01090, partial [Ottowia sp.]|nr:hypothetical protein [Ottowia sp.]